MITKLLKERTFNSNDPKWIKFHHAEMPFGTQWVDIAEESHDSEGGSEDICDNNLEESADVSWGMAIGQGIVDSNMCMEILQPVTWHAGSANVQFELVKREDLYSELAEMKTQMAINKHETHATVKAEMESELAAMRAMMIDMKSRIEDLESKNSHMNYELCVQRDKQWQLRRELDRAVSELESLRSAQPQQVHYATSTRPTNWFEEQYLSTPRNKSLYYRYSKSAEDALPAVQPLHKHIDYMSMLVKQTSEAEAEWVDHLFAKREIAESETSVSPASAIWAGYTGPRLADLTVAPSTGYTKRSMVPGLIQMDDAQSSRSVGAIADSVGTAIVAIKSTYLGN